ncbi:hypothetical protein NC653_036328 [Populus alba x Populus x berolinensis]|uniref:Uncharacterized protein n=1 Tax=Populus alba x Populus x berolinensis TaxID=444605 RepID=A0AAD6LL37_9ROSI|nr:hypothetical protein NC653_036328 [Populus alba x Populus x berolinensis]
MGRPEPSVLFSQTFVHPQLDEYVERGNLLTNPSSSSPYYLHSMLFSS